MWRALPCLVHCTTLPTHLSTACRLNTKQIYRVEYKLQLFLPMHFDYSAHSTDAVGHASALSAAGSGAGLHTAASCYWDNTTDGSRTVRWENKTMYCITTVFGLAL